MVEHFNQEDFERLKHEVETLVGRTIMSPKDFEFLTCQILGYTKESISISTLKRMWGYVASSCKPSAYNLNLLSRMVGYPDCRDRFRNPVCTAVKANLPNKGKAFGEPIIQDKKTFA